MKILITGGAGFLGLSLAKKFLKESYKITLFDFVDFRDETLAGKVKFIKGDIRNKLDVQEAVKGQDFIVHAAAILSNSSPKEIIYGINVDGTRNILMAAFKEKIKRFIFISSSEVYSLQGAPQTEDSPIDPIGNYGKSKVLGEKLCKDFMKKGLSINIIRAKTFLGPGRLGVFERLFKSIYEGKKVFVLGSGNNLFQLLSVYDLVDAIERAVTTPINGQIFNIGAKEFGTWHSDLDAVIRYSKSNSKVVGLPTPLLKLMFTILGKINFFSVVSMHYLSIISPSYISIENAEQMLKWNPRKSNKELLLECYKWYVKNKSKVKSFS